MVRLLGYAFILIGALTIIVWAVSQFMQPILPASINNGGILFFAALLSVLGAIAAFKDTVEFLQLFSSKPSSKHIEQPKSNSIAPIVKNKPKALKHFLKDADPKRGIRIINYGKCQNSPWVDHKLWFINFREPLQGENTFLVHKQYAHPRIMDEFDTNLTKWRGVKDQEFSGGWCIPYECLWKDIPIFKHKLSDGTLVSYGYSCSQVDEYHYLYDKYPNRELWFLVLENHDKGLHESFIVDKEATSIEFINKMGSDPEKWAQICWCGTAPAHTPKEMTELEFQLDSFNIPDTVEEIYRVLEDSTTKGKSKRII